MQITKNNYGSNKHNNSEDMLKKKKDKVKFKLSQKSV